MPVGRDPGPLRNRAAQWQPRLWLMLGGLAAVFLYLVAFVARNDDEVEIDFVFFSAHAGLIWLLLLGVGAGLAGGLLLSQLYRRRRGDRGG